MKGQVIQYFVCLIEKELSGSFSHPGKLVKIAIWRNLSSIQNEANSLVILRIKAFWLVQGNHAAVKLESSAVVTTYIFSIINISELNKEFPAISWQFVFICLTGLTLSAYKNPISPNIYPVACTLLRVFVFSIIL